MKTAAIFIICIFTSFNSISQEASNPFLNCDLNPSLIGQLTALQGEVIEIKDVEKGKLYFLDTKIIGMCPISIVNIARLSRAITLGDQVIFKGYISTPKELGDDLPEATDSKAILLSIAAEFAQ